MAGELVNGGALRSLQRASQTSFTAVRPDSEARNHTSCGRRRLRLEEAVNDSALVCERLPHPPRFARPLILTALVRHGPLDSWLAHLGHGQPIVVGLLHRRRRPQLQYDVQRPQHEHRVGPRAAADPQRHLFSRRLDRRPRGRRRRRPRLLRAARVRARAARPSRDGERAPPQGAALLPLARYADSAILAPFGAIL